GTPGQERFWFMWEELSEGALGAIVIADTRRLETCFAAVDFFERRGVPFVVAVNCFEGAHEYEADEVREALSLSPDIPVALCDARQRESAKQVLLTLVNRVAERVTA
ncbi:MAG: ATP/GTP-binding protein, partial [Nocardiopsis sp. BM-2018]